MSAFDIAGAVVWTGLAALFWFAIRLAFRQHKPITSLNCCIALGTTGAAIFCIARLLGAHL